MTDDVIRQLGRLAYLWAWPMVNMHNRRVAFEQVPTNGLIGGVVPAAPLNNITMLLDYAPAEQRFVATPNQDVVYGFGVLALDQEPVVVQVPDFEGRFWVYQLGDQRTDGFGDLGQMYGSAPGCYLLVGPGWDGDSPEGIQGVFRSSTDIGCVIPRVFMDDTVQDRAAVTPYVSQVAAYPLSEYTGEMRTMDWTTLPSFPAPAREGGGEVSWVAPQDFFGVLPQVLREVPPMAGEESIYELVASVLAAAESDATVRQALDEVALEAERELITPLFDYSNEGVSVGHGWGTLVNSARFGADYVTRTSCAKANIFANRPEESAYFFTDVDASESRLTGDSSYAVTFGPDGTPPVQGFWSLTLYDEHHFFAPNELARFSLGTKNQDLQTNEDGSLTIFVQHESPGPSQESNWLPAPAEEFSLFLRAYWPEPAVLTGEWAPPPVLPSTQRAGIPDGQRTPRGGWS